MKEVVKVSLAGMAFSFDQEAYEAMDAYLQKLNAGYAKNPDRAEIVGDIESRIVELILEHQDNTVVVGKELVDNIVGQLGFPDNLDEEQGATASTERFPRRLYRNMDGAKLSGVCNGIATYFNVDPVWVRVGFFAPLLLVILCGIFDFDGGCDFFAGLWGIFFLLYFILWICIPQAKTPRQKLEMRGEKVTASSIHNTFAEEAASVNGSPKSQKTASVWADIAYGFGRFIQFFLKALLLLIGICFGLGMLGVLVAVFALACGASWVSLPFATLTGVLVGISPIGYVILALVTCLMFLLLVCYLAFSVVFHHNTNRKGLTIVGIIFLLLFIWLSAITLRNIPNWEHIEERIEQSADKWEEAFDNGHWNFYMDIDDFGDLADIDGLELDDDELEGRIREALKNGGKVNVQINTDDGTQKVTIVTSDETVEIIEDNGSNRRIRITSKDLGKSVSVEDADAEEVEAENPADKTE